MNNLQKNEANAAFVVPEGWQLVPKKATPAMLKAGALARHSGACDGGYSIVGGPAADVCWTAMLEAAPTHNAGGQQEDACGRSAAPECSAARNHGDSDA